MEMKNHCTRCLALSEGQLMTWSIPTLARYLLIADIGITHRPQPLQQLCTKTWVHHREHNRKCAPASTDSTLRHSARITVTKIPQWGSDLIVSQFFPHHAEEVRHCSCSIDGARNLHNMWFRAMPAYRVGTTLDQWRHLTKAEIEIR